MTSWHSRNHKNSWFEQHINITQITYCCQKDLHLMGLLSRCMPRKWDAGWWSGQWAPTPVSICHSAMKFATSVIQLWIYYKPLQFFQIQDASHIFFFEWFSMIFAYFLCGLTAIFKGQYAGIISPWLFRFMDPSKGQCFHSVAPGSGFGSTTGCSLLQLQETMLRRVLMSRQWTDGAKWLEMYQLQ